MTKSAVATVILGLMLVAAGCGGSSKGPPSVAIGKDVVVEAVAPRNAVNVGAHYWKVESKQDGQPAHLFAFPSDNRVYARENAATESPGVEYELMFEQAGTYYLWVKGKGESGGASVIPGLDGRPLTEDADYMGFFPGEFSWLGGLHESGNRTVLQIDSAGKHSVTFWMREDGFRLEKFLVTSNAGFIPE